MNARLLSIYLYPDYYKVVGYLEHEAFVIVIDKATKELLEYHCRGSLLRLYAQDFIYDCAMQTINHNLLNIQLIQVKALDEEVVDSIEHNVDSIEHNVDADELAEILRRVTNQDAVDQIRNHIPSIV